MKTTLAQISLLSHKINRQHVQLFFAILVLAMLVLGAGAPMSPGGAGG
jgi:hypothetical protein